MTRNDYSGPSRSDGWNKEMPMFSKRFDRVFDSRTECCARCFNRFQRIPAKIDTQKHFKEGVWIRVFILVAEITQYFINYRHWLNKIHINFIQTAFRQHLDSIAFEGWHGFIEFISGFSRLWYNHQQNNWHYKNFCEDQNEHQRRIITKRKGAIVAREQAFLVTVNGCCKSY